MKSFKQLINLKSLKSSKFRGFYKNLHSKIDIEKPEFNKKHSSQEFKISSYEAVDLVGKYLVDPDCRTVLPPCKPNFLSKLLPNKANKKPESMKQIFDDLEKYIFPNITRIDGSGYISWFPCMNGYHAALSHLISNSFINPSISYKLNAPIFELERIVTGWFRKLYGLPDNFAQKDSGAIVYHGVSLSSIGTSLAAKKVMLKKYPNKLSKFKYYCSNEAHYSIKKGANICGFKPELIPIIYSEKYNNFIMDTDYLEKKLEEDVKNGYIPIHITATLGTTGTTGIDEIDRIGDLAIKYGAWFHVDAAYAGNASVLPENRWILKGVEKANSFCFNPVKLFPIHQNTACCFFANVKDAACSYEIKEVLSYYGLDLTSLEFSVTRLNKVLKMYTLLESCGTNYLQYIAKKIFSGAKVAENLLAQDKRFELMFTPVNFGLINFKLRDRGNDDLLKLVEYINNKGKLFIGPMDIIFKGEKLVVMRLSINWQYTTDDVIRDQIQDIINSYDAVFEKNKQ